MIELRSFSGVPAAVLGLGRSGMAAACVLERSGAQVWAWDDNGDVRDKARSLGLSIVDLNDCDWRKPVSLILSPGIPFHHPQPHPVVKLASDAGCEVIGDIELLARAQKEASFIGITGTNGKSTTTALLGHILESAGHKAQVGGNIGIPVMEFEPLGGDGVYVLEMSSYQLDLCPSVVFDVAVLLNISPDHLDRHGGMAGYIRAKRRIFLDQDASCTAVVGIDDDESRATLEGLRTGGGPAVIPVSGRSKVAGGVYALGGILIDDTADLAEPVLDLNTAVALPGEHNWQNAAAAYAAASAAGVDRRTAAAAIRDYPGLAHRQELITVSDGISYVNDSKATNPDAAAKALACYSRIYWIAGGRAKEGGLEGLKAYFGRVVHAFLIGEAENDFAAFLEGKVACSRCGDLATAVSLARARAIEDGAEGAVVLLSPACASFDQFRDFESRGDAFRALVKALPAIAASRPTGPGGEGATRWAPTPAPITA